MSERSGVGRVRAATRRTGRWVFGDRVGLAVFLATLCAVTLTWRAGVFITDNFTLVRGLEALSHGRVWLDRAGPDAFVAPGTHVRDGYVYGRNYGQLVLSLPALWGLCAVDAVVDLHVALIAAWHLVALALVLQVYRLTGYGRALLYGGSGVVVASFLANAALVRTFTGVSVAVLALQVTAAVAVGLVAVLCYRLVERRHGAGVGVLAGMGVAVATPLGLWATIPKRHAFSALLVVGVLYAVAQSRDADATATVAGFGPAPVYRAGAYALVGLFTTIHAAEALFVFFALVAVDVPTAPRNDRRTLAFVGGVFAVSMGPFFILNGLVTGELVRPPRAMGQRGLTAPAQENLTSGAGNGTGSGAGGGFGGQARDFVVSLGAGPVGVVVAQVLEISVNGLVSLLDVGSVRRTYLLSSVEGIAQNDGQFLGINLALLEAGPVLGAVAGAVVGGLAGGLERLRGRYGATDVLGLLGVIAFVLVYNSRLPLNTQITVRYLLVLYPLGAVLLARSTVVGRLLAAHRGPLLWSYTAGVALGSQLLLAYFILGAYAVGEAARVHAVLGAALGVAVAVTSVAGTVDRRVERVAAVALGLAAAAATVFTLLAGLSHFAFVGEYVLPVVGVVSELLGTAR